MTFAPGAARRFGVSLIVEYVRGLSQRWTGRRTLQRV